MMEDTIYKAVRALVEAKHEISKTETILISSGIEIKALGELSDMLLEQAFEIMGVPPQEYEGVLYEINGYCLNDGNSVKKRVYVNWIINFIQENKGDTEAPKIKELLKSRQAVK